MKEKTKCKPPCSKITKIIVAILAIIAIVVIGVAIIFVNQEQNENQIEMNKFIGKWSGEISNASGTWNMTFFKNNSVLISYYVGLESGNIPAYWEKYELKDKQLCLPIHPNVEPVCLNYEFSNNDTFLETSGGFHFMLNKIS